MSLPPQVKSACLNDVLKHIMVADVAIQKDEIPNLPQDHFAIGATVVSDYVERSYRAANYFICDIVLQNLKKRLVACQRTLPISTWDSNKTDLDEAQKIAEDIERSLDDILATNFSDLSPVAVALSKIDAALRYQRLLTHLFVLAGGSENAVTRPSALWRLRHFLFILSGLLVAAIVTLLSLQ